MLTVRSALAHSVFLICVSTVSSGFASAGDYVCPAAAGQCRGACPYQGACALGQTAPYVLTSVPAVQTPEAAPTPVASPSLSTEPQPAATLATTDNSRIEVVSAGGATQSECPYLVARQNDNEQPGENSRHATSNPIFVADESADPKRFPPVPAGGFTNIAEAIESVERWSATRTVVRRERPVSPIRSIGGGSSPSNVK